MGRGRVLDVVDVSVSFGAVKALDHVSLAVPEGAVVGLIGPNGAGKTTLFNVVSGFVAPTGGRIRFCGRRISRLSSTKRARSGMARTFQNVGLDKQASVKENVALARQGGAITAELRAAFKGDDSDGNGHADVEGLVERLGLEDVLDERVDHLPTGTAKLVEFLCALVRRPRLLMLDEPSSGLSAPERGRLGELLRDLHDDQGLSILMIEHDMALAMSTVDYLYVLNFGTLLAEGSPRVVRNDERVLEAYLGKAAS